MGNLKNSLESTIRDNAKRGSVFEFLKYAIRNNFDKYNDRSKLKIVSAYFTIYAFYALKQELTEQCSEIKFILGEPASVENTNLINKRFKVFKMQDDNITLDNILKQNQIAKECYEWLKQSSVKIHTAPKKNNKKTLIHGKMYHIEQEHNDRVVDAIIGSSNFTVNGLGINESSNFELNTIIDSEKSKQDLKMWFDELWSENTDDAKQEILSYLEAIYQENSPEQVYYKTLYHIFEENFEEKSYEDIDKNTKYTNTKIYKTLYKFQKDAVKTIVNRLNKYNGCILADSVGLGKTYTALGVAQWFVCNRKPNILVIAPKRLSNNWKKYTAHHIKNIFGDDGLKITLKFHTDLSLEGKNSDFAWDDFDLIIIDESHNFRNATPSKRDDNGNIIKKSRYDVLMDAIKNGARSPKVLMLSATPVNINLTDLKNQIRFISQDNDGAFKDSMGIPSVEGLIKSANKKYIQWVDIEDRNKNNLLNSLNTKFFKLLDELTLARSRNQIQRGYIDSQKEIGEFPKRKRPKKICKPITNDPLFPSYEQINNAISKYNLYLYNPARYLKDEIAEQEKAIKRTSMTQEERECYLIGMMKMGFLKRLESSIFSFTKSMKNTIDKIDNRLFEIDNFLDTRQNINISNYDENLTEIEEDIELNDFLVGKKKQYKLADLDVETWKKELLIDRQQIEKIYKKASEVTPDKDEKLQELKRVILEKSHLSNKKILLFTTFSDTAKYLYDNLLDFVKVQLGLNIALITGTQQATTFGEKQYDDILENFSPCSKKGISNCSTEDQIDVLIATDCISEGQNLQDCDTVINYDIHWNPVRLIQRFGRIDRIGSKNKEIQMICFWPTEDLETYIKLQDRVEARMVLSDSMSTADDNILEEENIETVISHELTYRERQLQNIIEEKSIENLEENVNELNMSDFSLEAYRNDLIDYVQINQNLLKTIPIGINAVVPKENNARSGVIFCLRQKETANDNKILNRLQPYYLVYVTNDGNIFYNYDNSEKILQIYKTLCLGKSVPFHDLCKKFNAEIETDSGLKKYSNLLHIAVQNITKQYQTNIVHNLSSRNFVIPKCDEQIKNDSDFELISWLVVV